jgi:hypothetical protein
MKFISAKHNEPFMLVAFPGDHKDEFVVRMVRLGKGSRAYMINAEVEWALVLDESSQEVQQEVYAAMVED